MGRLWQSLILGRWNPVFEHLPMENMVYSNQQAYYDAIAASTQAGQCGAFIDFMLGEIASTLEQCQGEPIPKAKSLLINTQNSLILSCKFIHSSKHLPRSLPRPWEHASI